MSLKNFFASIMKTAGRYTFTDLRREAIKYYHDLTYKLTHLAETNKELGIYHFTHGNTRDCIMRLKAVQTLFKDEDPQLYYILGRSYMEMNNMTQAESYIDRYLASNDDRFREEAIFCKKVITRDTSNITEIPETIFMRKVSLTQKSLPKLPRSIESEIYNMLINALKTQNNNKVLEIHCRDGYFGRLLVRDGIASHITATEPAKALRHEARSLQIYDKVLNQSFEQALNDMQQQRPDIILMHNALFPNNDLRSFFQKAFEKSSMSCIMAISLRSNIHHTKFNERTESIEFNRNDIEKAAEEASWNTLSTHIENNLDGSPCIFIFGK